MDNRLLFDWITFTTKIHTWEQIVILLGLDPSSFSAVSAGVNRYQYKRTFENITICYTINDTIKIDGSVLSYNAGVCVIMSGKGCRDFEHYGTGDYRRLFKLILDNWSADADDRKMNLTRIDLAFDDFNGGLDLQNVANSARLGYFVSSCKCTTIDSDGNVVNKGKYNIFESECGLTVYFGSRSSNTYLRFYDKYLEQLNSGSPLPGDIKSWVRTEIELKKENCIGFLRIFLREVSGCKMPNVFKNAVIDNDVNKEFDIFFGILNNYIRFVVPTGSDTNIRRWSNAPWWDSFLCGYSHKYSTFINIGVPVDIDRLTRYHNKIMSASEVALMCSVGIKEYLFIVISGILNKQKLKPEYIEIVNKSKFSDDWSFYDLVNIFLNNDPAFLNRVNDLGDVVEMKYIYDIYGQNTGVLEYQLNDLFIS